MSEEAWPSPTGGPTREPLPRVEDLPIAEHGYEPESVKEAFDSFYRHAAQLDAALRTLEAVDSFHRHAAALRADLRALRSAGWTQQSWGGGAPYGYGYSLRTSREGISPAVWRISGEVAFLIAASVALGVSKLSWWVIVAVMAGAFLIVVAIEWLSARDQFTLARPEAAPSHPVVEAEAVAPAGEAESVGWTAFEEAQEPSDAMTMIAPASEDGEPVVEPEREPIADIAEPEPQEEPESEHEPEAGEEPAAEQEPEHEPEPVVEAAAADEPAVVAEEPSQPRRRWFRRRAHPLGSEEGAEPAADLPHHVRVLSPDERAAVSDPWEQGFDEAAAAEPDEETDEELSALAGEPDRSGRRRFRRR